MILVNHSMIWITWIGTLLHFFSRYIPSAEQEKYWKQWNLKLLFLFSKWKSQASFWLIQIWPSVLGQEKNILEARSFDQWKSNNTLEATLEDTLAVRNKKNIYIDQSYFDKNEIIHWKQRWKILWLVTMKNILF